MKVNVTYFMELQEDITLKNVKFILNNIGNYLENTRADEVVFCKVEKIIPLDKRKEWNYEH